MSHGSCTEALFAPLPCSPEARLMPHGFRPVITPGSSQAKTVEEKRNWTHHIKRLILENHHTTIPQKVNSGGTPTPSC